MPEEAEAGPQGAGQEAVVNAAAVDMLRRLPGVGEGNYRSLMAAAGSLAGLAGMSLEVLLHLCLAAFCMQRSFASAFAVSHILSEPVETAPSIDGKSNFMQLSSFDKGAASVFCSTCGSLDVCKHSRMHRLTKYGIVPGLGGCYGRC